MPAPAPAGALVSGFDDWDADGRTEQPGQVADPLSRQARLTAWVRGRVQGVGFRWWVRSMGLELDCSEWRRTWSTAG